MSAKSFFYACAGIFLLVAAWTMGAHRARADWQPSAPGSIIGGTGNLFWDRDGALWSVRLDGGWEDAGSPPAWERESGVPDLPLPISEIKFVRTLSGSGAHFVMSNSDVPWIYWGSRSPDWVELDPYPGGTISVEPSTVGDVKGKYKDEE